MQVAEIPVVAEQIEKAEMLSLLTISAQVSFDSLLTVIQTLPTSQKWQIYQALGLKLAPQSAEAKAIARLADEDDESKWITVVEEGEEIDEEVLNKWLVKRGYQEAASYKEQIFDGVALPRHQKSVPYFTAKS